MIICGIDASTTMTGLAIFDDKELLYYTKISSKSKDICWEEKVCEIIEQIVPIIKKYKVDNIYMEDVPQFTRKGSKGNSILKPIIVLGGVHMAFYYKLCNELKYNINFLDVSEWRKELGFLNGNKEDTKREAQKQKAIDYANKQFGLDLYFVPNSKSKKQDDDIAEAICIAWSQIKPKEKIRGFKKG